MIALFDADILLYRFAFRNEAEIQWEEGCVSQHEEFERAVFELNSFVESVRDRVGADSSRMVFSGNRNFRYDVEPTYKYNRLERPHSPLRDKLKAYIREKYWCLSMPRIEGDDLLGILTTEMPGRFTVCTIDKDLQQIPGRLYNWDKDVLKVVTEEEADRFFFYQIIKGDPGDGYSGCPGAGDTLATDFLNNPFKKVPYDYIFSRGQRKGQVEVRYDTIPCDDIWEGIVSLYEWKGLDEAEALKQARLARILTTRLYNKSTDYPILWTPSIHKENIYGTLQ